MFMQGAYILGTAKGMEARAAHQITNEAMPPRISELEWRANLRGSVFYWLGL
jgi:hypothetical protein